MTGAAKNETAKSSLLRVPSGNSASTPLGGLASELLGSSEHESKFTNLSSYFWRFSIHAGKLISFSQIKPIELFTLGNACDIKSRKES